MMCAFVFEYTRDLRIPEFYNLWVFHLYTDSRICFFYEIQLKLGWIQKKS